MKKFKSILFLILILLIVSCEGLVGERGIVVDSVTGERLDSVKVVQNSREGNSTSYTNISGVFDTHQLVGCGFGNCDDNFSITFEKEGYDIYAIDENYSKSSAAEYINRNTRDSLIIRLMPK